MTLPLEPSLLNLAGLANEMTIVIPEFLSYKISEKKRQMSNKVS